MARPIKDGIDYFPFDVDFATNEKAEAIMGEFGAKGTLIFIYLLSAIYRKGYYLQWTELAKNQLANRVNGATGELVQQVVDRLVAYGTFNKELFNSAEVLTSQRIQGTYLDATKRRKSQKPTLYWINVDNNHRNGVVNVDINTQSKVKERKVNKNKKEQEEKNVVVSDNYKKVFDCYSDNIHPVSGEIEVNTITEWIKDNGPDVVLKAINAAVKQNKRTINYINGILNNWQTNGVDYADKPKPQKRHYDISC
ncbi:Lin1244/Lin1753 domain-containing protein [Pectinatus frisingensis]|uniref:Lin1244/Lin1753 domain-containing protein n=1 Tax=Pectinatus frisingensis TaxID=865 RepID=UPI0018C4AC9C|nr:Lin1244/Lin1753 domain-containing protein [Pectinatus frisingensis]